jgi:hypothetical protein
MRIIPAACLPLWAGLAVLLVGCNQYDPFHPDTANLVGVWSLDNSMTRSADEEPVTKTLTVYATHMEFCPGQGTFGVQGEWRDDGFWCEAKDGSGEIEAAKMTGPEHLELHLAAFHAGDPGTLDLYKQEGSDEEKKAVAARYPAPYTYPPPFGAIPEGMTEYQLRMLPWKPDKVEPSPYESAVGQVIYHYHSDDPKRSELQVTVRNHVVMQTSGGNA